MNVTVHLYTILQRSTPEGIVDQLDLQLLPGTTLDGLLQQVDLPLEPDALLLVVNGRMAELDQRLQEGDQVHLMPAISGGKTILSMND